MIARLLPGSRAELWLRLCLALVYSSPGHSPPFLFLAVLSSSLSSSSISSSFCSLSSFSASSFLSLPPPHFPLLPLFLYSSFIWVLFGFLFGWFCCCCLVSRQVVILEAWTGTHSNLALVSHAPRTFTVQHLLLLLLNIFK